MNEIILHHYPLSPFSEKVRRILAFKQIPWRSVETPIMLPKADLTALTGGYRRAPVMQIGADVYCDSALIARRLEELFPEPPLLPAALSGAATIWEDWADHRLIHQVVPPVVVELLGVLPAAFFEDRVKMTPNWSREAFIKAAPSGWQETCFALDALAAQLAVSDFLLGEAFTLADAACFNPIGFLRNSPSLFAEVTSRPTLAAWVRRIEAFGPGTAEALNSADSLAIARHAQPTDTQGQRDGTGEYRVGDRVSIIADDYGLETLTGTVLRIRRDDITLLRDDAGLGAIAVHYPRSGYCISRSVA